MELLPKEYSLEELVQIVDNGIITCLIVGDALKRIKSLMEPKAFEELVEQRWGWTKRYANQLIVNYDVLASLPEPMQKSFKSGAAVKELAKVSPMLRLTVAEKASAGGKQATSTSVKKAVPPPPKSSGVKNKPAPPQPKSKPVAQGKKKVVPALPKDSTGCEIPAEIQPLWDRGAEAENLLSYADAIEKGIKKAGEISDANYVTFDFAGTRAALKQVILNLRELVPHAICATCGGKTPKDCQACKGRGFVSQFFWNTCVPSDLREMRKNEKVS